jgi:small-conductance mechanosensitive channel
MPEILSSVERWQAIAWAPPWLVPVVLAASVAGIVLIIHNAVTRSAARHLPERFVTQLLIRTSRIVRLAVVVFAISAVLPFFDLRPSAVAFTDKTIVLTLLVLACWELLVLCDVGAERYLRGFRLDVADNLEARKAVTQVRILKRTAKTLVVVLFLALMLMTFDTARQFGVSLMASAGAAGIVLGLAARPVLGNLIAGVQIAVTQPIRVDDAVVVEGEWGWIEEINSAFVVIKLWDWRRLVVPLGYFIEKPFQNWTRTTASIIGTVYFHVDYTVPVQRVREKLEEVTRASELWDRQVVNLQVTESLENSMQLRALVSASTSPRAWDLRCEVREKLIAFLQREYPDALPRQRVDLSGGPAPGSMAASPVTGP